MSQPFPSNILLYPNRLDKHSHAFYHNLNDNPTLGALTNGSGNPWLRNQTPPRNHALVRANQLPHLGPMRVFHFPGMIWCSPLYSHEFPPSIKELFTHHFGCRSRASLATAPSAPAVCRKLCPQSASTSRRPASSSSERRSTREIRPAGCDMAVAQLLEMPKRVVSSGL